MNLSAHGYLAELLRASYRTSAMVGSRSADLPTLSLATVKGARVDNCGCCHAGGMGSNGHSHGETIQRIKEVRAQAIEHTRRAQKLAAERRDLMQSLIKDGLSQSDFARELGVTRQAIQKMLSI
jgi:hypothetical protein